MAGMLPGVECARRRRLRPTAGDSPGGSRRSSLGLYATNYEASYSSFTSSQRSVQIETKEDEKLRGVAREAKERLDERLRLQRKSSDSKRQNVDSGTKSSTFGKLRMIVANWRPSCEGTYA
ncbi:unnamed protein product [Linum trigynum]|uniref:Uncharacterized protein n=1 Tax=Linum trigynum TaxID=586398 RepID=A0AAV2GZ16_9ROSI